jgi:hypothetical protein
MASYGAGTTRGSVSVVSNNDNNSNGNGNNNNNSNGGNNSNPLSGIGSTLSKLLFIGLIFVILFYVLLALIAAGVLWIAVILRRRLPLPEASGPAGSASSGSNPSTGGAGSK